MTNSTEPLSIEEFISARLDEDEQLARTAAENDTAETGDGSWFAAEADHHGIGLCESESQAARIDYYPTVDTEHITRHHPARVLKEVAAKRKALHWYLEDDDEVMRPTIRAIAAIWSDHPDYRQEWAPTEEGSQL